MCGCGGHGICDMLMPCSVLPMWVCRDAQICISAGVSLCSWDRLERCVCVCVCVCVAYLCNGCAAMVADKLLSHGLRFPSCCALYVHVCTFNYVIPRVLLMCHT